MAFFTSDPEVSSLRRKQRNPRWLPAADFARDDLVEHRPPGAQRASRQRGSPNHIIEFDEHDSDRAICYSHMYAQHHLTDSEGGDFFLLRGSYTNHMLRTSDGWRIQSLTQHISWPEGNDDAITEATACLKTSEAGRAASSTIGALTSHEAMPALVTSVGLTGLRELHGSLARAADTQNTILAFVKASRS